MIALKYFEKEIGSPKAITMESSRKDTFQEAKQFLNHIGTTLRVLEEGTMWANKVELFIELLKETLRKDMNEVDLPLVFCDYCLKRIAKVYELRDKKLFQLYGSNP